MLPLVKSARSLALATTILTASLALAAPREAAAQITGEHSDKLSLAHVSRPLTLPEMHVRAELDGTYSHFESGLGAANGGALELGGAFGLFDDVELEAVLVSLELGELALTPMNFDLVDDADWGVSRFGATVRFLASDVAEVGGRFRFFIDRHAALGFGAGLPVVVRGAKVVRLDTGIHGVGRVPTNGANASFGLVDASSVPFSADAGIPLRLSVQAIEELWFGLNTGFGAYDVSEDDTIFLPLGLSVGGSVPLDSDLILDVDASFLFPTFVLPAARGGFGESDTDAKIGSELWQIGLGAKVNFPIPR